MNTNASPSTTQLPVAGWADTAWPCTLAPAVEGSVIGADGIIAEVWFPSHEYLIIGSWADQVMFDIREQYLGQRSLRKVYNGQSCVDVTSGREQWHYPVKAREAV